MKNLNNKNTNSHFNVKHEILRPILCIFHFYAQCLNKI